MISKHILAVGIHQFTLDTTLILHTHQLLEDSLHILQRCFLELHLLVANILRISDSTLSPHASCSLVVQARVLQLSRLLEP